MCAGLSVEQSQLTRVLARLISAGVLTESRRHVRGEGRRLKDYQLTPLGESLAREIDRAERPPTASSLRPPPGPATLSYVGRP
ncbi:MAG: hypothetical protein ACREC5_08795 [Thermoplasmata archaeon]